MWYKLQTVSVIIPLYNKEEYILDCIRSVQNQTWVNLEIIIINDGSTDGGEKKVLEVNDDSRIQFYSIEHSGPAKARNVGIEHAKGEFITSVDADDLIEPTYVERMVSAIDDADICMTGFKIWHQRKNQWNFYPCINAKYSKDVFLENYSKHSRFVSGVGWKLYRTKHLHMGKFEFPEDMHYGEDFYFFNQILSSINKLSLIDDMSYIYRYHDIYSVIHTEGKNFETLETYYNRILELYDKFLVNGVRRFLLLKEIRIIGILGICLCRLPCKFTEKRNKFKELVKKSHVKNKCSLTLPKPQSKLDFLSRICVYINSFVLFYVFEKVWRISNKETS